MAFAQSLQARVPSLFFEGRLADNVAVSVPMSLDGERTGIFDAGIDVGRDHYTYVNGHVLRTAGDRLRWAAITVEDGMSKYDFVADLTIQNGSLTVNSFQLNTYALGVKLLTADEAADYLNEYMREDNDWHAGYTTANAHNDKFHPLNDLQIPDEHDAASVKRIKVTRVPINVPTAKAKFLRQTEDKRLEEFSTKRGATIHGILWAKNTRTGHKFYPMFICHKLRVQTPKQMAGLAGRVLCAAFCDCHEPGGVNLADSIDELRQGPNAEAVFIVYPEDVVLHFFHKMTADERHVYGKALDQEPMIVLP